MSARRGADRDTDTWRDVDEPPGWNPHDDGLTQADRDAEADRAADRYEQHMRGEQ